MSDKTKTKTLEHLQRAYDALLEEAREDSRKTITGLIGRHLDVEADQHNFVMYLSEALRLIPGIKEGDNYPQKVRAYVAENEKRLDDARIDLMYARQEIERLREQRDSVIELVHHAAPLAWVSRRDWEGAHKWEEAAGVLFDAVSADALVRALADEEPA